MVYVLRAVIQVFASLEDCDAGTRGGESGRYGRSSYARSDDDDIRALFHAASDGSVVNYRSGPARLCGLDDRYAGGQ
ncbi:hypothetical protein D3C84_590580 [compost metagenome]